MENITLEITSESGTKYQFVEFTLLRTMVNAYSWYNGKWNRLFVSFNSLEEAHEWVENLNKDYQKQKNALKTASTMPASAYYSTTGYYGD